ncbi:hypothetical protein [Methylocystis heyeri]|uniref:Uncharacterized protein n=1 Tax=Methylocystis heyeri TaxID=391905 RepID=A0A6B8KI02_9HYPH|nr:hypothetical protein [Methylocystis heyeri]QGM46138.1 hypothetical protein H2LOC_010770 [Methylocystis heyeri]
MARTDAEYAELYIQLRDKKKAFEDKCKESIKPVNDAMDKLESYFLNKLNQSGGESLSFPAATVYKSVKSSASVADAEVFRDYVMLSSNLDLLDIKANVTAVEDHIGKYQEPPPGVNFKQYDRVGFRRK